MNLEEKIVKGWDISAEGYSNQVVADDFATPGREIWTDLILSQAPRQGTLRILDVGTGPGVFPTILSLAGHEATGIDISPKMIEEARKNAARHGANPEFRVMDSQAPDLGENAFDMVVGRNVVLSLEHPEKAYANWLRLLKPGGRVVIFDGGHPQQTQDDVPALVNEARRKAYFEKFGEDIPISFDCDRYEEARGWKRELKLTYEARPEWDVRTLGELGYVDIHAEDVGERANYSEKRKFLYGGTDFFRLVGSKPA